MHSYNLAPSVSNSLQKQNVHLGEPSLSYLLLGVGCILHAAVERVTVVDHCLINYSWK